MHERVASGAAITSDTKLQVGSRHRDGANRPTRSDLDASSVSRAVIVEERRDFACRAASKSQGRRAVRERGTTLLVAVVTAVALGLSACGGTGSDSPSVANVSTTTSNSENDGSAAATVPKNNAAQSLVEWANCMRSHGDPNQPDPTIDAHGGIDISIPESGASLSNAVHNGTAPCNGYLATASADLRAGASDLTPPDQVALVKYSQCMRANGVPNYPDPGTGSEMNFRGLGIDPNSPFFLRANDKCGKQIDAPSWWISGAGPPGNISVQSGPIYGNTVCSPSGANRQRPSNGVSGPTVLRPGSTTAPSTGG